jgi:hypothetical protein
MEKGILNIFVGLGFLFAALAVTYKFPGGIFWGWSLLIPGFSTLGRGVASIIAARRAAAGNQLPAGGSGAYFSNPQGSSTPPLQRSPQTGQLMNPVPSVTEGTTRHLGAEAPTRHFDPVSGDEKMP